MEKVKGENANDNEQGSGVRRDGRASNFSIIAMEFFHQFCWIKMFKVLLAYLYVQSALCLKSDLCTTLWTVVTRQPHSRIWGVFVNHAYLIYENQSSCPERESERA